MPGKIESPRRAKTLNTLRSLKTLKTLTLSPGVGLARRGETTRRQIPGGDSYPYNHRFSLNLMTSGGAYAEEGLAVDFCYLRGEKMK
jgi:hypothetical protein